MAKSFTGRLTMTLSGTYTNDAAVGNDVTQTVNESVNIQITNGTGANQANRYVKKTGTATTTPADAVDLSGTSTDDFGGTTDFTEILAIWIENTGSENLIVGGEAGDITWLAADLIVPAGGSAVLYAAGAAGMPVTATTADTIAVTAAANTTTYELSVVGRA